MAQVDVTIHRLNEFTVESKTSDNIFWVDLSPESDSSVAGLTFFVDLPEEAEALTAAFEKCGARRLSRVPDPEVCNAAEEFAHSTSERR